MHRHCLALLASALLALTALPLAADPPADLALTSITFVSQTVDIKNAGDGSNRLFLVSQPGTIRIFDLDTDQLLATPFLDIQSLVDDSLNEQGLLGLAFHPNYAANGHFYVNYTRDPGAGLDRTVIRRYTVSAGDANVADPASGLTLLEIEQDDWNHNGGDLKFGPDGYLYLGMGDGGGGFDPNERSQDPGELLGKMLRIDVDAASLAGPPPTRGTGLGPCGLVGNYGIPGDNPYVNDSETCAEIWAFGVRNPWRFSFDRQTGDLLIADVGQGAREEVNFQPASSTGGENYGWDCREGTIVNNVDDSPVCDNPPTFTEPVLDYNHGGGRCSITGGYVYRGAMPSLKGDYVYADYCSGQIWFTNEAGGWTPLEWGTTRSFITTFGEDEAGELYAASGGTVYQFTSDELEFIFTDGFESGNTSAWSTSMP